MSDANDKADSDLIHLAVNGAAGRMGQRIVALAAEDPELKIVQAIDRPEHPLQGHDAGEIAGVGSVGVPLTGELTGHPHAVVDFSSPDSLVQVAEYCGQRSIPLVAATTGLTSSQREIVLTASQTAPLVFAPNTSLAVNVAMMLCRRAAEALRVAPGGVDAEIIERHHRYKEDAPSGTALRFGEIIGEAMGEVEHRHGRHGQIGPRPQTEIGYHALRTGDNVGEHTIVFGLLGETLELTVRGHTRDSYARGALAAAKFLVSQGAGEYTMADVLGLS